MKQEVKFSVPQRNSFVVLIKAAKERESEKYGHYRWERGPVSDFLLHRIEADGHASALDQVRLLKIQLQESEKHLNSLGYELWGEDGLALSDDADPVLKREVEKLKQSLEDQRRVAVQKYDTAILEILAAQTADEAKGIVERYSSR